MWQAIKKRLFNRVDGASLAVFRIAFGTIMLWEVWRYFSKGWIAKYFIGKEFTFGYWPFEFIQPWPEPFIYVHFVFMAIFAMGIMLGLYYRASATGFFLLFGTFFLWEQANYLNHFYLVTLLSFLMIWLPANRVLSLDAVRNNYPDQTIPGWALWLLRLQIVVPMFFGGIAKINHDWLRGEPLRTWLAQSTEFPVIGSFFVHEPVVMSMVYGGLLIDLLFVFYILNRRTRFFGMLFVLSFHFLNARLFSIGIFPWFMMMASLIFFSPHWPRAIWIRLKNRLDVHKLVTILGASIGGMMGFLIPIEHSIIHIMVGAIAGGVVVFHYDEPFKEFSPEILSPVLQLSQKQKRIAALIAIWTAVQLLVPLRHYAIAGDVHWTEEGHKFSWHMKLREKNGSGVFVVSDATSSQSWYVHPQKYLSERQASKMNSRPDMIIQFARFLEELYIQKGRVDVEVRANISSSLNTRSAAPLINPEVDLTKVPYPWFGPADWIPAR